jgi:hypothetical protein
MFLEWRSLGQYSSLADSDHGVFFLGSKGRLVRRADNLTAISEPII